ncbi:MAG: hypothetical protein M1820_009772 [Bogoriella megaspora]|nr:MAG: hypothetical protein M1820_009772 [Bogoriella megaspora]
MNTRNTPALDAALAKKSISHACDTLALQLTDLDDARVSAGKIPPVPPIRALILNAGFQDFGNQKWTPDGLDITFAANYLGHWLLTLLLLKSVDKKVGRIIIIGSQSHDPDDKRNAATRAFVDPKYRSFVQDAASFDAIAKGTWSSAAEDSSFRSGFRRYGASKLFLTMMQHELQSRLNADTPLSQIAVLGVDPGNMISGMQRLAPWFIRVLIFQIVYPLLLYVSPNNGRVRRPSAAAADVIEAALGEGGREEWKYLYFDGRQQVETSAESRDAQKRKIVWKKTVEYVHLEKGETVLEDCL